MVPVVTFHIDILPDHDQKSLFDLSDNVFFSFEDQTNQCTLF